MIPKGFIIIALFTVIQSAKILVVVPTPSISHQMVFRALIHELIDRDHEVVVITTDPVYPQGGTPNNLKEINLHDLSYTLFQRIFSVMKKNTEKEFLNTAKVVYEVVYEIFQQQLRDQSVLQLIRDKTVKFDLLIIEESVTPALIFSHIFVAPVIIMSSFGARHGNIEIVGAHSHPFLYTTNLHQRLYNLTTWEKISCLYNDIALHQILKNQESYEDEMLRSFLGIETPTISELKNNVHTMFLNIHPIWVHNQPVPPNLLYTWGIHRTPEKKLPLDLQSYLDLSKNGAIYVSFGSNFKTSSLPSEILEILVTLFSRLPYNILWKWDTDEMPGKSENIKISKWLPQYDVLRHPNLKLFITQGGLQSTDEAIKAGVPLIGFPNFVDQAFNTEKYVHFKIGIKLSLKSLTVEKFENAIETIFTNYDSYKSNIIQLRTQMQDQPKPALEHALWWIEYVLRHGGAKHLRTPAANISWMEYYELELVLVILTGLIIFGTILLLIMRYCFKLILSNFYNFHLLWLSNRKCSPTYGNRNLN